MSCYVGQRDLASVAGASGVWGQRIGQPAFENLLSEKIRTKVFGKTIRPADLKGHVHA